MSNVDFSRLQEERKMALPDIARDIRIYGLTIHLSGLPMNVKDPVLLAVCNSRAFNSTEYGVPGESHAR